MKRIVVCDDNTESTAYLRNLLDEYFSYKKVKCEVAYYNSGEELILTENSDIDVAILDVEMDKLNGIQTGYEILRRCPESFLMITTSYMHYLDQAMDLRVFRYFDKPVDKKRLFHALDIALRDENIIDVPTKYGVSQIGETHIVCIHSSFRKSVVLTDTGNKIQTELSIKDWLERLENNNLFASPHYSYIVNLHFIQDFSGKSITLQCKNGENIKIYPSKRKYPEFKNKFYEKMREFK